MKDIYRIYLDSEELDSGIAPKPTFNIKIPKKRTDYTKYTLYVDDFCISLAGETYRSIRLHLFNCIQYNSYNSSSKGSNNVIATIFNPNITETRTIDLSLNYQAPTTPYIINCFPDTLQFEITDETEAPLSDFAVNAFWVLNLRIEAEYD
jgi:hypothetical protein|tara:strand:- start:141 stop:590 length:450 start_codon:yes stop_codon:yes gene_type:complete